MLIDREKAIGKVEELRQVAIECHNRRIADGLGALALQHAHYIDILDQALDLLRALPVIGTCKDCADWHQGVQGYGECSCPAYKRARGAWTPLFTEPAHFCAAWRAKA